jgi:hypothetical protein
MNVLDDHDHPAATIDAQNGGAKSHCRLMFPIAAAPDCIYVFD